MKLKVDAHKLTAQRILEVEKLKVIEKDLQLGALREKVSRLEEKITSQSQKSEGL